MSITDLSRRDIQKKTTLASYVAVLIAWCSFAAAQDKTSAVYVPLNPLVDVDGNLATDPTTPLYSRLQDPREAIIAPDGHHITLEEWLEAGGQGHITRTPQGTELSLELTGLVPNGVYTVWSFFFTDPPFNFAPFINTQSDSVAMGAVGTIDGSESILTADENGTASYVAMIPPGPLSISGEAPLWVLDGYSSYAAVGVYNIDGQTYGTVPGPHHVGHFVVGFVPEPSSAALALVVAGGLAGTVGRRARRNSVPRGVAPVSITTNRCSSPGRSSRPARGSCTRASRSSGRRTCRSSSPSTAGSGPWRCRSRSPSARARRRAT